MQIKKKKYDIVIKLDPILISDSYFFHDRMNLETNSCRLNFGLCFLDVENDYI